MTFDRESFLAELERDEGRRLKPYVDTVGKVSIGVGRNLTDRGISDGECDRMRDNDIAIAELDLDHALPWWRDLGDVRQRVLLNMCFNLGITRLLGFRKALAAMRAQNWETAANEMMDSTWAGQVGDRALQLAQAMRTGVMPS